MATAITATAKSNTTFSNIANIIRLLPTGTVFLFHFLNPILTNNGACARPVYKYLSSTVIALCGLSCCFSCFTDSYQGDDGATHYGIVTPKGLWPSAGGSSVDLTKYKLRFGDFVHAMLSVFVFTVLALLDTNTVRCFYPSFESTEKTLVMVLPTAIGVVSGGVFALFPGSRHGIGYESG
ncbi:hypothetical protein MLD38_016319 [Melastoma candidum]|uniref:Uncharacterized protein n=1 Tax=Melastoma candidum TaxID=119954 RepID=A0ACB9RIS3_9MYRT|nr:hypothetical protein MLD38_016319 [Melastoma candidum]